MEPLDDLSDIELEPLPLLDSYEQVFKDVMMCPRCKEITPVNAGHYVCKPCAKVLMKDAQRLKSRVCYQLRKRNCPHRELWTRVAVEKLLIANAYVGYPGLQMINHQEPMIPENCYVT